MTLIVIRVKIYLEVNMNCKNCGAPIEENQKFCGNCGTEIEIKEEISTEVSTENKEVIVPEKVTNNQPNPEDEANAKKLCIASLLCYFGGPFLSRILNYASPNNSVLSSLLALSSLAGIALMIVARIKYPENRFARILMWVYICLFIGGIVLGIIGIILLFLFCKSCDFPD